MINNHIWVSSVAKSNSWVLASHVVTQSAGPCSTGICEGGRYNTCQDTCTLLCTSEQVYTSHGLLKWIELERYLKREGYQGLYLGEIFRSPSGNYYFKFICSHTTHMYAKHMHTYTHSCTRVHTTHKHTWTHISVSLHITHTHSTVQHTSVLN